MTQRITRQMVERAFSAFVAELYADSTDDVEMGTIELSQWSPGDRYGARYRVEMNGQTPLGSWYWLGAREAYYALWTATNALRWMRGS